MDISSIISGFYSPAGAVGLSIFINPDNSIDSLALEVSLVNKEFVCKVFTPHVLPLESLSQFLPVDKPIHLVLDGKGIVHRKLFPQAEQDPLHILFPNARKEDFISQSVLLDSGEIQFSLIRQEQAETILMQLYNLGYKVISLSLGPFAIQTLSDKLERDLTIVPHWEIKKSGNDLVFTPLENTIENSVYLDSKPISSSFLTAFAVASQTIVLKQNNVQISCDLVETIQKEQTYRSKFNRTGLWFVAILFLILMVNFLVLQNLNQSQDLLIGEMSKSTSLLHKLDSLNAEYQKKSSFLSKTGTTRKTKFSQYADELAMHVKPEITLTRLDFNPPLSKPKLEQEIRYNQQTCIIAGKVQNGVILDNWLDELKSESWVLDAEVMDYKQDESQLPAFFSLRISIR